MHHSRHGNTNSEQALADLELTGSERNRLRDCFNEAIV